MDELAAGIDIGGTNITYGLVDRHGKVIARKGLKTHDFPEVKELVKTISDGIAAQITEARKEFSEVKLIGIGIGAPNGNPYSGSIEYATNLVWKGIIPLVSMFTELTGVNCKLTNDAKAATLGELIFGAAKGMKDILVITLGTGLGGGIISNGELLYGSDGFAGEIGHVILVPDGRLCGCGRKGCLETYCSATGLVTTYRELNTEAAAAIEAREIADRATNGEAAAIEAFRLTGERLGFALANSVIYTSPEAIFLFGGLIRAGELLFKPTRESFQRNLLRNFKKDLKILPSVLHESDAAILGAASLIWKK